MRFCATCHKSMDNNEKLCPYCHTIQPPLIIGCVSVVIVFIIIIIAVLFMMGVFGNTKPTSNNTAIIHETIIPTDVNYVTFYENYQDSDKENWIRIAGRISSIEKNSSGTSYIEIKDYLPDGIATSIHINIDKNKLGAIDGLKEDDFIIAVGKVGSKVLGRIDLNDGYIENTGDVARKRTFELLFSDAIEINISELIKAYDENQINADNLYNDKILIVNANIDSIGKNILDEPYLTINDGNKYSFSWAQCFFKSETEIQKIAQFSKGQPIKIIGKCIGLSILNVLLTDCFVIN